MHEAAFNWLQLPSAQRQQAEALQFQLSQTQAFDPAILRQLQLDRVNSLMQHACKTVPYYKNHPQKTIGSWEQWRELPVLTRQEVQKHSEALRTTIDLRQSHGGIIEFRSSGSTGRPIHVLSSAYAQLFWRAITLRDHLWQNRDFSSKLAVIKFFPEGKCLLPGNRVESWGASTGLLFNTGPCLSLSSSTTIDEQYQWLLEAKAGYLLTYPSLLKALAQKNLAANKALSFSYISSIGEALSPELRGLVQESFSCKIADIYSAQEVGYIALQCPKHDHYHIQSESAVVEVLSESGDVCEPGELGRVVVTPLHNYVTPLIRYEIGDYAIAGEACDCGIKLPVISQIAGRTRNLVTYPDNTCRWPSYNPMKLMDELPGVQFQLIQKEINLLQLTLGTNEAIQPEKIERVKSIVQQALGHPFTILINQQETIPRASTGKYEEFISELKL